MDQAMRDQVRLERRMDNILSSNLDPLGKVQHIIKLGFDEEIATEIVERYQSGLRAPVYYERLDFSDLDEQ